MGEDTLISLVETLSLRPQMEETLKPSGSIKDQRPSSPSNTLAGLGTSRMVEEPATCKCGVPTQDGSNSSNTKAQTSSMSRTAKFLMLSAPEMLKAKTCKFITDTTEPTKDGP